MNETNLGTILVVEDDPDLREIISYDFREQGYKVLEAENGSLAFEIVKQQQIDLILSDIRMPNGDGVELLKNIRILDSKAPPLIFISGFSELTLEEAYERGAHAIFSKPFNREALFNTAKKAITDMKEKWQYRRTVRSDANFNIDLIFDNATQPIKAYMLNIGRGGFFVAMDENFPAVGTKVTFNIFFQNDVIFKIEGTGIVRWLRNTAEQRTPYGCGIEFAELGNDSRKQIIGLINELQTNSYTPKN